MPTLLVVGWLTGTEPVLWLLPSLAFTTGTLALGGLIGVSRAAYGLITVWGLVFVLPTVVAGQPTFVVHHGCAARLGRDLRADERVRRAAPGRVHPARRAPMRKGNRNMRALGAMDLAPSTYAWEIQATGLKVRVGRGRMAVDGVDLALGRGVHGLLGPNGAGKSTLIRTLATVLRPTAGELSVLGTTGELHGLRALRRRIGYLPQDVRLLQAVHRARVRRVPGLVA